MTTFGPVPSHSPLRGVDEEHDGREVRRFLTIRQLAVLATLGTLAWGVVLTPLFL